MVIKTLICAEFFFFVLVEMKWTKEYLHISSLKQFPNADAFIHRDSSLFSWIEFLSYTIRSFSVLQEFWQNKAWRMLLQTAGGKRSSSLNFFVSLSWGSFVFLEKLRLIEYVIMHPQVRLESGGESTKSFKFFLYFLWSFSFFLKHFMT